MKKAVAYCRVSTDGQVGEDKFGISSQKDMIGQYCEKNDIEITGWYIDEGVSGAAERRPELDKILSGDVTNPPVEYVIVAKADRISRDINLYYAYKNILSKLDLEIISVSEDWSAQDKLTAMILENFLAMAATVERENIRIRTSGGRAQKARQGGYSGGRAPMGYRVQDGELVINPDELPVVVRAFELRDNGETLLGIVDTLNSEGYTTRNGKRFVISTVQSIVNNRKTYEGFYHYGKNGEWVKGKHEPILKGANVKC